MSNSSYGKHQSPVMEYIATIIGLGIAFFVTRHFSLGGWQVWLTWIGVPFVLTFLVGLVQGVRQANAEIEEMERLEARLRSGEARRDFESSMRDLLGDDKANKLLGRRR